MRLSAKALKVFGALVHATEPMCGADLYRATGVGAGTIYPTIARLEQAGWLTAEWGKGGRPRKRLYMLTDSARASVQYQEIL